MIDCLKQLESEIHRIPREHLPELLQIVKEFHSNVDLKPVDESFKQGWQEMLTGEVYPIEDLWKNIK